MGASVLRRNFKASRDSCNEFISSSIACRRYSLDSAELVSMRVIARWSTRRPKVSEVSEGGHHNLRHTVSLTEFRDRQASKGFAHRTTILVIYWTVLKNEERKCLVSFFCCYCKSSTTVSDCPAPGPARASDSGRTHSDKEQLQEDVHVPRERLPDAPPPSQIPQEKRRYAPRLPRPTGRPKTALRAASPSCS